MDREKFKRFLTEIREKAFDGLTPFDFVKNAFQTSNPSEQMSCIMMWIKEIETKVDAMSELRIMDQPPTLEEKVEEVFALPEKAQEAVVVKRKGGRPKGSKNRA